MLVIWDLSEWQIWCSSKLSTKKVLKPRGQVLTSDTIVHWKKHFIWWLVYKHIVLDKSRDDVLFFNQCTFIILISSEQSECCFFTSRGWGALITKGWNDIQNFSSSLLTNFSKRAGKISSRALEPILAWRLLKVLAAAARTSGKVSVNARRTVGIKLSA